MNIDNALGLCRELQSDIHMLLSRGANNKTNPGSEEQYRDIMHRMKKIAEIIYPNPIDQISDHDSMKTSASERDHYRSTHNFYNQLRSTNRFIQSMIDQLSLREIETEQSNKIDKIENQIIEKDREVLRRGKVVDTKIHGASIEMIDRLREELKRSTNIKSDILEIKNELGEINKVLSSLNKNPKGEMPQ